MRKGYRVYVFNKTREIWQCQGFYWEKAEAIRKKENLVGYKTKINHEKFLG